LEATPRRRNSPCSRSRLLTATGDRIQFTAPNKDLEVANRDLGTVTDRGRELIYAARVRAGLVSATQRAVFEKIKHLKAAKRPFANLPELSDGRWGAGLTTEKMKECVWLRPEAVAQIAFLEWTGADHLRHTKFVALRDDKDPKKVVREA
jgi:ATP-dependent DNA ligase